jgi:transcriptional antiterminator NusG
MSKAWYVVHTYSGYENKVQKHVRMLVDKGTLKDHVYDVKVPSEEVVEIKDGHKKVSTKKFLPGYIMVEMDLPDPGWKEVCQEIRKIPGVTGFVGSNRNQKPQPISQDEARGILQKAGEIKADRVLKPRQSFSMGEMVRIIDGPFDSFTGSIEEVNTEKGKLRVMVGIFGRSTPVEVDFLQVEKI